MYIIGFILKLLLTIALGIIAYILCILTDYKKEIWDTIVFPDEE